MKITTNVLGLVIFLFASEANAGIKWLSRANCIGFVNESITYDRPELVQHLMATSSKHVGFGASFGHELFSPMAFTWRSRAGDQLDSSRNTVTGLHTFTDYSDVWWSLRTVATNCNLGEF